MCIFIGIDQSYTNTGYCILNNSDVINIGTIKSNKNNDIYDRCYEISTNIGNIVKQFSPKYIGIEGLAFGTRGNATRDLSGLQFQIIIHLRHYLKYENIGVIAPTTLKKFATGYGRSKKKALYEALPDDIKELIKENGFTSIAKGREDITDAYWVAMYLKENH